MDAPILITGATGFIGSALVNRLQTNEISVRAVSRCQGPWQVSDFTAAAAWERTLQGVDAVVHLAARVHVMHDRSDDPLSEFRRINVDGTLHLARQAAAAGVRRFVFLSSIKVNGETTSGGRPFTENDFPEPQDPYGISKHDAELELRQVSAQTGMEVVIIRPPLVYGPGVRANFLALIRAVARGMPLPLAAVDNRRSLIGLDNLVDFIQTCISHPVAANEVFLVSDGEDLSTPELIRRMSRALGKRPRLFSVPTGVLTLAAGLVGRSAALDRLRGNLQVDITKAQTMLGWSPPVTVDEQLAQMVSHIDSV